MPLQLCVVRKSREEHHVLLSVVGGKLEVRREVVSTNLLLEKVSSNRKPFVTFPPHGALVRALEQLFASQIATGRTVKVRCDASISQPEENGWPDTHLLDLVTTAWDRAVELCGPGGTLTSYGSS